MDDEKIHSALYILRTQKQAISKKQLLVHPCVLWVTEATVTGKTQGIFSVIEPMEEYLLFLVRFYGPVAKHKAFRIWLEQEQCVFSLEQYTHACW